MAAAAVALPANYPVKFHQYDICKDSRGEMPALMGSQLLEKVGKIFGFPINFCEGYDGALKRLKKHEMANVIRDSSVLEVPINRLARVYLSERENPPILSGQVQKAIYDSGPLAKTYQASIETYNTIAGFTDPGPSSHDDRATASSYPALGQALIIPDQTFNNMFPNSLILINDFTGTINADHTCRVTFNIRTKGSPDIPPHQIVIDFRQKFDYDVSINGITTPVMNAGGLNTSVGFFHGNATKNEYLRDNREPFSQATILSAVLYVFCKEFLGDILIGLIGKHYDVERQANQGMDNYAVFTGDGMLELFCSLLNVNHVAVVRDKSLLEEAVLRLFSRLTQAQQDAALQREKGVAIDEVTRYNTNILITVEDIVNRRIAYIENVTPADPNDRRSRVILHQGVIDVFRKMGNDITKINTLLDSAEFRAYVTNNPEIPLKEFMEQIKLYKVRNPFRLTRDDTVVLFRGIHYVFAYVPEGNGLAPLESDVTKPELVTFLQRIQATTGVAKKRRQDGGNIFDDLQYGDERAPRDEEELKEYMEDPDSLLNRDPTNFMLDVIGRVIGGRDISWNSDKDDIYNFIYQIMDRTCKISFNQSVIRKLVDIYIHPPEEDRVFKLYDTYLEEAAEEEEEEEEVPREILMELSQKERRTACGMFTDVDAIAPSTPPRKKKGLPHITKKYIVKQITKKKQNPEFIKIVLRIKEILKRPEGRKELRQYIEKQPYHKKKLFAKVLREIGLQVGRGRNKTKKLSKGERRRRKTHKK